MSKQYRKAPEDVSEMTIEDLKQNWRNDPCWDIERTEGFEEYAGELLEYRLQYEYERIKVDDIQLAAMFVELAKARENVADLEKKIERQVLGRKETVKIAGLVASYYKPSDVMDYETCAKAWEFVDPEIIKECTHTPDPVPYTSWKDVCEKAGIEVLVRETKPARVVIK